MENDREIRIQLEDLFSDLEGFPTTKEDVPFSADASDLPPVEAVEETVEQVVERKRARRQVHVFRALVENIPDAIFISDAEGRHVYANPACLQMYGYRPEDIEGLPLTSLWREKDGSTVADQLIPAALDGGWRGDVMQKHRDGTVFDARVTAFPVKDESEETTSIALVIRDISDHKALERERDALYEHRAFQTHIITGIAQDIAATTTLRELYRRAVTLVKERFGYYHVQIFRHNPESNSVVLVESYVPSGEPARPVHYELPYGEGVVGSAAATGKAVLVPNTSMVDWSPYPDFPDTRGELAIPIRFRDQVLGVLDVLSDTPSTLTREDEIVLTDLAGRIASAIENTRQIEETNVLRQFSKAPEGIGWITLEGNLIIYMNATLCSILGEDRPEDTFGKPILSYYPAELRRHVQKKVFPTVIREGQWSGELALLSGRGQLVPTIQSIFLIRDENGDPLYLANVVTDITEQKQAEMIIDQRTKQINCLNDIGHMIDRTPEIPELLQWVTERIPPAMRCEEACLVAIEFQGKTYGNSRAMDQPCQISEEIRIGANTAGQMLIAYVENREFLEEERTLLSDVARRMSHYVESRQLRVQTQTALEQAQASHQRYVPGRWNKTAHQSAPQPVPAPAEEVGGRGEQDDEEDDTDGTPPGGDSRGNGLGARLRNSRLYTTLQKTLHRATTGLFLVGVLILLGTTISWTFRPQARADPSTMAPSPPTMPFIPAATKVSAANHAPVITRTRSPTPPVPTIQPPATASPTLSSEVAVVVPSPFPTLDPGVLDSVSTTFPVPTPVPPIPVAEDGINIVVLGSDQRPDWSEWHTDVVQVISIQRDSGAVSVISIPRDLYLYIPGFWMSRINFADFYGETYDYEGGGPALIRDTLMYNLGIRIDHYVRTNFDGLIGIVDTVGGIDVPVHCRLSDYWPLPDENGEYSIFTLEPGMHHLDGETALWYARSRLTTSVFSREQRQQQVLQGIWHKARDIGMLSQVPALWKQGHDMVETDLTLAQLVDLAQIALKLEDHKVRFYNIGADVVTPWTTPYGGHVYLSRWEKTEPILAEALAPTSAVRSDRNYRPVEVWNGTPNEDWGLLAADRVLRAGFPAVIGEADRPDYAKTQLIVFGTNTKGTGAEHLQQTFGLSDDQVVHREEDGQEFGFRLIVGQDYQTCPHP